MGEGAGLEGVLLASVPTMPVPLIKARGQKCRMTENKNHCLAAIPGSGEWPGQALQDDTIPQDTGGGGGGWEVCCCQPISPGRSVIDKKPE